MFQRVEFLGFLLKETGYQQTLLFWIRKYLMDSNINGIEVVPLKPRNRTKESRIRLFIAELYSQNYHLFASVRAAFVWQAMKYKIGKKKNKDDLLDACAYGLDVRTEYWHLVKNLRTMHRFIQSAGVVHNNTPF